VSFTIHTGDCLDVLRRLPSAAFQCCVTSPPYYGLRDYGADGQIGLEPTPAAYVARLVEVFREVRRVLREDGTLWLNIGDSYAGSWGAQGKRVTPEQEGWRNTIKNHPKMARTGGRQRFGDAKPKDLLGIPWMLAFALRADGWWLRSDVIWHKRNPMPESAEDRPTSAHEHVFLLAKSEAYFYDGEAISEEVTGNAHSRGRGVNPKARADAFGSKQNTSFSAAVTSLVTRRNARNVWTIASQPFSAAKLPGWDEEHDHFATMPCDLAERCIKAGTSERGQCPLCGSPWRRVVERQRLRNGTPLTGAIARNTAPRRDSRITGSHKGIATETVTVGWEASCSCPPHTPVPQAVLDPFGGAGTTALVADRLGRDSTLIELNPLNVRLARARLTADAPLLVATTEVTAA